MIQDRSLAFGYVTGASLLFRRLVPSQNVMHLLSGERPSGVAFFFFFSLLSLATPSPIWQLPSTGPGLARATAG